VSILCVTDSVGVREFRQNLSAYLRRVRRAETLEVTEPESTPPHDLLMQDADQVASAIVEIEVVRAVRRGAAELTALAQKVVSQISVIEPTETIRARDAPR
jgi:hypothetical protein